jgi:hypothetical protein
MKSKNIKLSVFLLGICITTQAQQATSASGGDASGSGGTVAYSVGQMVYTTHTDASGTISQGVQQAYEIFTVGIEEAELHITLSAYPNPTTDYLTLEVNDIELSTLHFQLYDIQGKLLRSDKITARRTQIITAGLSASTYFIHVVNQDNKHVQSFKIIKN